MEPAGETVQGAAGGLHVVLVAAATKGLTNGGAMLRPSCPECCWRAEASRCGSCHYPRSYKHRSYVEIRGRLGLGGGGAPPPAQFFKY